MTGPLFIATLLFYSTVSYAEQQETTPKNIDNLILGEWEAHVSGTDCYERRNFRGDGVLYSHASEQVLTSKYNIASTPSPSGFYTLEEHILTDNGGNDCLGMQMPDMSDYTFHLVFSSSGNELLMCLEEKYDSCIGPYIRVLNSGSQK
ncbi:hypothetical protein G4923_01885 [Aeromonas rivipollensis]|uniref:Lipocalin-like domain-containing protein n=1 Tax=Aeromonas rivipollensis TaxID=948519 RepID=A0ABX0CU71_9GAMM|nr:hypothetical protein [Aeromonas rivipollensis]NEX87466.1 hypothetical protein [Aeromonas rivipollensis]NEY05318.1 hypothetical protein [Aeromonas rivipollensis]